MPEHPIFMGWRDLNRSVAFMSQGKGFRPSISGLPASSTTYRVFMKITLKKLSLAIAGAGLLTIYGCGGGGGGTAAPTSLAISGTAATGAAISGGPVTAKCVSGTASATTNADGTYTVSIANGTGPCLLKVTATDATGATTDLYSAVEAGQTSANITPLTQMVVANALGADPATVYNAGLTSTSTTQLSASALTTAVTRVKDVLTGLGIDITGIDPLKAPLVAATDVASGNAQDKQIDGLMAALKNANVPISAISTALAANTSTGAAIVAAIQAAAPMPISISGLSSCPVARSGKYLFAAPGDTSLGVVNLDFVTLTGVSGGNALTIAPVANTPCAYTFTLTSIPLTINVRVSASGLAAFSTNNNGTFPNSVSANFSNNSAVGLILPMQKTTVADLAGTMYAMHFSKPVGSSVYKNIFSKFVMTATDATSGTATAYSCDGLGVCGTTPINTFTYSGPDANNQFTFVAASPTGTTKIAVYRSPSGDTVAMGVNTGATSDLIDNYVVMSNRVSAIKNRVVGSSYSIWDWGIINTSIPGTPGPLAQTSVYKTFTVNSVDSVANSFTRTSDDTPPSVDTIFLNTPRIGVTRRPAVTTPVAKSDSVSFSGNGWSVSGSTTTTKNFFSISINAVQ